MQFFSLNAEVDTAAFRYWVEAGLGFFFAGIALGLLIRALRRLRKGHVVVAWVVGSFLSLGIAWNVMRYADAQHTVPVKVIRTSSFYPSLMELAENSNYPKMGAMFKGLQLFRNQLHNSEIILARGTEVPRHLLWWTGATVSTVIDTDIAEINKEDYLIAVDRSFDDLYASGRFVIMESKDKKQSKKTFLAIRDGHTTYFIPSKIE